MPKKAPGIGDRPAQRNHIAIFRDDRIDANDIAVGQQRCQACEISVHIEGAPSSVVVDSIDRYACAVGHCGSATGCAKQCVDRLLAAQFENGGLMNASDERYLWTGG